MTNKLLSLMTSAVIMGLTVPSLYASNEDNKESSINRNMALGSDVTAKSMPVCDNGYGNFGISGSPMVRRRGVGGKTNLTVVNAGSDDLFKGDTGKYWITGDFAITDEAGNILFKGGSQHILIKSPDTPIVKKED